MKHRGCEAEFVEERGLELLAAFRRVVLSVRRVSVREVAAAAALLPCSRFWVSEERATAVVQALLRGQAATARMRPMKRAMFEEIHRRVAAMMADGRMGVAEAVRRVVYSPAPCFYMAPGQAIDILYRMRKRGAGK